MKNLAAASDYFKNKTLVNWLKSHNEESNEEPGCCIRLFKKNKTLNKAIYVSVEIEKEEDPRYKVIYRTLHDYQQACGSNYIYPGIENAQQHPSKYIFMIFIVTMHT